MEKKRFELDDKDLNISVFGDEREFDEYLVEFMKGYKIVFQKKGNTLHYTADHIYPFLKNNCLWGEALHLFIEWVEQQDSLPVGRILSDVFLVNLYRRDEDELSSTENNNLRILNGLNLNAQSYLAYKLLKHKEGKVVFNSLVRFLLAYDQWKTTQEKIQYYNDHNDDDDYQDPDLLYWLDVADGEATSDVPPSERYSSYDFLLDEFKPLYEKKENVEGIVTPFIELVLECSSIPQRKQLDLIDFYMKCVERQKTFNSSLIYGQLSLLTKEFRLGLKERNIPSRFLEDRTSRFFQNVMKEGIPFIKLDFSDFHPHCCYLVYAHFDSHNIYHSLSFKRIQDPKKEYMLFLKNADLKHQSVQLFVTALFSDLEMKCPNFYEKSEKIFEMEGIQKETKIDKNDLPWVITQSNLNVPISEDPFKQSSYALKDIDDEDLPF